MKTLKKSKSKLGKLRAGGDFLQFIQMGIVITKQQGGKIEMISVAPNVHTALRKHLPRMDLEKVFGVRLKVDPTLAKDGIQIGKNYESMMNEIKN